jgi:methenyltetrahydrofolate cyclohydrolase
LMLMADLTSKTLLEFADEVAAGSSAPGGGSVAALAGSLGAALGSMVARLTIGKPGYEAAQGEINDALNKLENLRRDMMTLVDEDTAAFNRVTAAYAMVKDTGPAKIERSKAIQEAFKGATAVPLKLSRKCGNALDLVRVLAAKGNPSAASDAGVGGLLLYAGMKGAAMNVDINLGGLKDQDFAQKTRKELEGNMAFADEKLKEILTVCHQRMS